MKGWPSAIKPRPRARSQASKGTGGIDLARACSRGPVIIYILLHHGGPRSLCQLCCRRDGAEHKAITFHGLNAPAQATDHVSMANENLATLT